MDFIVYFNGGAVGYMSAPDLAEAQRNASATHSRPVVAIALGASEGDREEARRKSIKLNQDANYSQPLVEPTLSTAARRLELYLRSQPVNCSITSGTGPMLYLSDLQTVLLQRQLLLASLQTVGEQWSKIRGLLIAQGGAPAMDQIDRLIDSINYHVTLAVRS